MLEPGRLLAGILLWSEIKNLIFIYHCSHDLLEHQQRISERVSHVCDKLDIFDNHGSSAAGGGGGFRSQMTGTKKGYLNIYSLLLSTMPSRISDM